ncbi:MAG TPA: PPK2 family polyphosphate kinase [Flavitalea sp.]|nr:PPK2 family polyphosphate kinase [Flavitalea sp.]
MDKIKLDKISTRAPKDLEKDKTKEKTTTILKSLNDLQNLLYAESKHAILVILQGMDASGKDGVIRNVFGSFNPQGVMVRSFKVPTEEEMKHDFLWRIHAAAPQKGMIQIFNRSQYEDILVTRVHKWCDDETAKKRMKAINEFEQLLTEHNNTTILKFYLHVSEEEQRSRLDERISDPTKQWKFNERDFEEAKLRKEYIKMYEDCFEHCNVIPWTIVPVDQNWYKEYLIASTLLETMQSLNMKYPSIKKTD